MVEQVLLIIGLFLGLAIFLYLAVQLMTKEKYIPGIFCIAAAIGCFVFLLLTFANTNITENAEYQYIIETKELPRIDTVITTNNGIADTTYVYKFK